MIEMPKALYGYPRAIAITEGFALYLLTGAACLALGTSLPQLIEYFNAPLAAVTALGSAFALGRLVTVFFVGLLAEKLGAKFTVGLGLAMLFCFFAGIPLTRSVQAAMAFSVLGGIGMGAQDAACPAIFLRCFPGRYPSALSAGQAFFGIGCFLPSLILGFILKRSLPFFYLYYFMAALCFLMFLILPLMEGTATAAPGEKAAPAAGNGKVSKSPLPLWPLFAAVTVFYCATTNTIGLYATSYAAYRGIAAERAVYILTFYNAGSMAGSLIFAAALRRVRPLNLLCANLAAALLCMTMAHFAKTFISIGTAYFFTGFCIGFLFSILIVMAVALHPGGPSSAGAVTAMVVGSADFTTPLVTGKLVTAMGIPANLWFIRGTLILCLAAALIYRGITAGRAGPAQREAQNRDQNRIF